MWMNQVCNPVYFVSFLVQIYVSSINFKNTVSWLPLASIKGQYKRITDQKNEIFGDICENYDLRLSYYDSEFLFYETDIWLDSLL